MSPRCLVTVMSVERREEGPGIGVARVGVDVELAGALVVRAGAREERVVVPTGSTIADVVTTWSDRDGEHVRLGLLDGDRLRSEVLAERVSDGDDERLVASDRVQAGDAIRFRFRD